MYAEIHLNSPGCPQPSIAIQADLGLKHHSFYFTTKSAPNLHYHSTTVPEQSQYPAVSAFPNPASHIVSFISHANGRVCMHKSLYSLPTPHLSSSRMAFDACTAYVNHRLVKASAMDTRLLPCDEIPIERDWRMNE